MSDQTPDLAALEALAEAAKLGPLEIRLGKHRDLIEVSGPFVIKLGDLDHAKPKQAEFVAQAPAAVLWLIREVKRLRRIGSEWTSNYESWVSATRAAERERDALIERVRALVADWQANGNSRDLGDRAAELWHQVSQQLLAALDGGEPE